MTPKSDEPDPLDESMRADVAARYSSRRADDGVLSYETPPPRSRVAATPAWVQIIAGLISGAAAVAAAIYVLVQGGGINAMGCLVPVGALIVCFLVLAWIGHETQWRYYLSSAVIGAALAILTPVVGLAILCGGGF